MNLQQHKEEQTSAPTIASASPITGADVIGGQQLDETSQTQPLAQGEREAFLARLQQQAHRQKRSYTTLHIAFIAGITLYLTATVAKFAHLLPRGPWEIFITLLPCIYLVFILGAKAAGKRWQRSARSIREEVATRDIEDPRYTGPLIEAYAAMIGFTRERHNEIRDVLIDRLSKLRANDAHLIDAEQRKILNRLLLGGIPISSKGDNARFAFAILKAYEQIGDSAALPVVEQIAAGAKTGKAAYVRQEAQECLAFLRQRAEAEQANRQLLRAADGNVTPIDLLLRPAVASSSEMAPQQLLRAEIQSPTTSDL